MTKTRKARLKALRRIELREREVAAKVTDRLCCDRQVFSRDHGSEWYQVIYDDIVRTAFDSEARRKAMAAAFTARYSK